MAKNLNEDDLVSELTNLFTAISAARQAINTVYELLPQFVDGLPDTEKADSVLGNDAKIDQALKIVKQLAADKEAEKRDKAAKADKYACFNSMVTDGGMRLRRGVGPLTSASLRG